MMFLTGCSGITVKVATDCAWYRPNQLDDQSKAWLRDHQPWPLGFVDFLNGVADNNDLAERFCP